MTKSCFRSGLWKTGARWEGKSGGLGAGNRRWSDKMGLEGLGARGKGLLRAREKVEGEASRSDDGERLTRISW